MIVFGISHSLLYDPKDTLSIPPLFHVPIFN